MSASEEISNYEDIGQGILDELNRRLGDSRSAQDLPGTHLMKLAENYLVYLQKKQALEEARLSEVKVDPLSMIDQPGLSLERRIAILAEYIADLEDVWRRASERMESLLNAQEDVSGDVDALPELSDMVPQE